MPVQGLKVWLFADSGMVLSGSSVSQWNDLSGNGLNFIQSNPSSMPQKQTDIIDIHSAVYFDGIDDFLNCNFNDTISQPLTFFVLVKLGTLNSSEFIFDGLDPSYRNAYVFYSSSSSFLAWGGSSCTFNYSSTDFCLHTVVFNSSTSKVYINGNSVASGDFGTNSLSGIKFGSYIYNLYFLNGWVSDILIYNHLFTNFDRINVENYLMNKYAPLINLGSDSSISHGFCPYTIHAGDRFTSYLWSTGSTADSIVVNESGDYWVQVTDIFNRTIYQNSVAVQQ